jgi:hypothetical protein
VAQIEDGNLSLEANGGPGYERLLRYPTDSIDSVAGREVVACIHHHIRIHDEAQQDCLVHALMQRNDVNFGIDSGKRFLCGGGFGSADAIRAVSDLPLEIGQVNDIAITNRQFAYPARGEVYGDGRAQPTRANQEHVGLQQRFLALYADFRQQNVATVTQQLIVIHHSQPAPQRVSRPCYLCQSSASAKATGKAAGTAISKGAHWAVTTIAADQPSCAVLVGDSLSPERFISSFRRRYMVEISC